MRPVALVAAMSWPGRVIGAGGKLPWSIPEDMKHFRALTTGHAIIMGRKTYESIGQRLPKRTNIVLSRDMGLSIDGCYTAHLLDEALAFAWAADDDPMVIGGAEIYAQALPKVTVMHITKVFREVEGDTFFPEVDWSEWALTDADQEKESDDFQFERWARR